MRARPEGASRVDHDDRRVRGRLLPWLSDPYRPDADRPVEVAPAVLPALGDVLRHRSAAEGLPQPLLAVGIGVGDELDAFRLFDLLEAVGEQLDHSRARELGSSGGDGHRDAPRRQRNALFSFSKKPSSTRYVSSVDIRSNSSRSRRCSSESWRGTRTFTSTRWSPRPNPCRTGRPFPRRTRTSPGCVPGGKVSSASPSRVGTVTVVPSAACGSVSSTVE